jgi:hypothetical protein
LHQASSDDRPAFKYLGFYAWTKDSLEMTSPIAFTDEMLERVMAAAALLPVSSRDAFLKSVAGRVAGLPNIGTAEIETAIQFVLNSYGVIGGHQAFTRPRHRANNRSTR